MIQKNWNSLLVLSPHLDDAVLSVGGLLAQEATVSEVLTLCTKLPLEQPEAMATVQKRQKEDTLAMKELGVSYRHLDELDAYHRRHLAKRVYPTLPSLFAGINGNDPLTAKKIAELIASGAKSEDTLLCPLGVGAHVDHLLCAGAGALLKNRGYNVLFYEDFPYIRNASKSEVEQRLFDVAPNIQWKSLELNAPIDKKTKLVEIYESQVKTLFGTKENLREALSTHPFERVWLMAA